MTEAEHLILRGQHLLLRAAFVPNDQEKRVKHVIALQADIGPWLADYATIMEKGTEQLTAQS
jgi:hypothetical protein